MAYPGDDFGEFGRNGKDLLHTLGQVGLACPVPGIAAAVFVLKRRKTWNLSIMLS